LTAKRPLYIIKAKFLSSIIDIFPRPFLVVFSCPKCGNALDKKYFDGDYWLASREPVWTCGACNNFYRAKELKKNLCCV
jgi:hypothetical protein